jgi:hypothetical protein
LTILSLGTGGVVGGIAAASAGVAGLFDAFFQARDPN